MSGLKIGSHPFPTNAHKDDIPLTSDYKESIPVPEAMATGGSTECQDDSDCTHDAACMDKGSGAKHCFCYDIGDFCNARQKVQVAPCGQSCGPNEECHPTLGCICHNMMTKQQNGTCPGDNVEIPIFRQSTTPMSDPDDGVIPHPRLRPIVNHTTNQPSGNPHLHQSSPVGLTVVMPLALFLFLGVIIIAVIYLRRQRKHRLRPNRSTEAVVKSGDGVMLLDRMNNINKNPTYFVSPGEDDPTLRKFMVREICMDYIVLVDVVGEGAFGQVYRGEMHCPETNTQQLVAVKVLKENVSHEIREDFEREVEIMSAFDHDNILKLVGVVTQNAGQSPYMIFEYMVHGDLAELLRKNDPVLLRKESGVIRLQKPDLVDIATQIANGMRYLTSQHFVHRDLATRNCLVGEGLVVKISDFGMSRDIYTCDYYKIGGSRMLPVRWMSPESVKYGRFTSESDAWAYGVVLWEIFSCGRQPYYGHSNEEVVRFLDAGILLQRPEDCPSTIYHIMLGCWKADPKERHSFDKIHKHLHDYHGRLVKMAAASQPTTPVASESEIRRSPSPIPSSPELQSKQPPTVEVLDPRPKALLKTTWSDPPADASKLGSSLPLLESCRTSSPTLTQHRVQPMPDLCPKPQEIGDAADIIYNVKLPPIQSSAQLKVTATPEPESNLVEVSTDQSCPATRNKHESDSLTELRGVDSGFSSEEQQWNLLDAQSVTPDLTLSSGDALHDSPSSIVCTNPTEVV